MLKHTASIIVIAGALGLAAVTVASIVLARDARLNPSHLGLVALAWGAALTAALAFRETTPQPEDRRAVPAAAVAAPSAAAPASADVAPARNGSSEVLEFARELHSTLESDRLRLLIARRLPTLVGLREVWVVALFGTRRQIVVPALAGQEKSPLVGHEPRQWATYPLKADGQTIGLLGAAVPERGLPPRAHRLLTLAAPLVAQALATANAFETMREASVVDVLTGCATRAEGARRLEAELRRAQRTGTSVAVLMVDLDHFKSINDRYGHRAGDAVLGAVGQALLATLRASDGRCRWGGEEFMLFLPESNVERAERAADKLRQRIASTPVGVGDEVLHVRASVGVTLSDAGESDVEEIVARADTALYEAKRQGRNCTRVILPGRTERPRAAEPHPVSDAHRPTNSDGDAPPLRMPQPWNGVERRDATRPDRRAVSGPGRRATDAIPSTLRRAR